MAKKTNNISRKKNYAQEKLKYEKEKQYELAKKKLRIFPWLAIGFSIAALLLFLVDWAAVYNTDMAGNEVRVSGYNCLIAALGGNFSGTESAFGDIAMPFNYYAQSYTHTLAFLTVAVFAVVIVNLVVRLIAAATQKQLLQFVSIALALVEGGMMIACFVVALSMKNAQILSVYCSGNPACSIKSQAVIPAILSFLSVSIPLLFIVGHKRAKEALER